MDVHQLDFNKSRLNNCHRNKNRNKNRYKNNITFSILLIKRRIVQREFLLNLKMISAFISDCSSIFIRHERKLVVLLPNAILRL